MKRHHSIFRIVWALCLMSDLGPEFTFIYAVNPAVLVASLQTPIAWPRSLKVPATTAN